MLFFLQFALDVGHKLLYFFIRDTKNTASRNRRLSDIVGRNFGPRFIAVAAMLVLDFAI